MCRSWGWPLHPKKMGETIFGVITKNLCNEVPAMTENNSQRVIYVSYRRGGGVNRGGCGLREEKWVPHAPSLVRKCFVYVPLFASDCTFSSSVSLNLSHNALQKHHRQTFLSLEINFRFRAVCNRAGPF